MPSSLIAPRGNPAAPIYILLEKPLSGDEDKGYHFSSGYGYMYIKMLEEAGITDYYVTSIRPDVKNSTVGGDWESYVAKYKPPVIIPLDTAGRWLNNCLTPKRQSKKFNPDVDSEISKYAGSILLGDRNSVTAKTGSYIIPTFGPAQVARQWKIRDIVVSCDLTRAAEEAAYYALNNKLQPLPERKPQINFDSFDELLALIDSFREFPYISNDIETIYPKPPTKTIPSQFYKILPGYPITIGLAPSPEFGISFDLFRESASETRELWKALYRLLRDTPSIGQNFFNFDAYFYEMLGFKLPLDKCRDTMILHHQLWPELPHKLQFLARQYTREPYWKDEGAGWSPKNMDAMKIYNCKDVMVTFEIFLKELEELKQRGLE